MRALVVGAGVVGQVHGRHLALGGADVTFLVKARHAADAARGFTMYPLNRRRRLRAKRVHFTDFAVATSAAEVARTPFDQVYLTMSSPALRAGGWFAELAPAIGRATLVVLQPGPDDRAFVLARVPEEQVVQGLITLVGYHAPLPGESRFPGPGAAYWFPPLAASPLSGPAARLAPVIAALRAGGLPARRVRDVAALASFPTAALTPWLAMLEAARWSFRELRRGRDRMAVAARASAEALRVMASALGRGAPWPLRVVGRPLPLRGVLRLAPLVMPMDVEAYLRAHFTKVGDQTRDLLDAYVARGRADGLPVAALEAVRAAITHPGEQSPRPDV